MITKSPLQLDNMHTGLRIYPLEWRIEQETNGPLVLECQSL